jgi:hypothetical protein
MGDADEFAKPVAALISLIGPRHISFMARVGSQPSALAARVFRRFIALSTEFDIAYPLLPAPIPSFQERSGWRSGRRGIVVRMVTVGSTGSTADLAPPGWASLTFIVTPNRALPVAGSLTITVIAHNSSQGGAGIMLTNWAWPNDRPRTTLALAGYDALVCGEGCNPTDAAALIELAAACALPVVLLSYPANVVEGTRLSGFPFITIHGLRTVQNTSDAAVISAVMHISTSAVEFESLVKRSRSWLHSRLSSSRRSLAKVLGHPLHDPSEGAVDSSLDRLLSYDELSMMQQRTVAFFASELAPMSPGGAGVIASAMAMALVDAGLSVIVIGDFACDAVMRWDAFARRRFAFTAAAGGSVMKWSPLLSTHCADDLVLRASVRSQQAILRHVDPYIRASIKAAVAVQVAYHLTPFVGIEFFDFNGPAYELLRARTDGLAVGNPQYLPPHVHVWVRAHGTMGAIDEVEVPLALLTRQQATRHHLEQYCLEAADAVMLQSPLILDLFSRAYQLRSEVAIYAPPPMQMVADIFLVRENSYAAEESCYHEVDTLSLPCGTVTNKQCQSFLVLGKLQRVKSPKTIAAALGLALAAPSLPYGQQIHAVFVGGDAYCEEHNRQVSDCLPLTIPRKYRSFVHVAPPVSKNCVPLAVSRLRPVAAILASEFETFNLVAHELVRLGLPVVVSDVAGYAAFFNVSNAYVFRAGDAASLAVQLLQVIYDASAGCLKLAGPLVYDDAVDPYQQLLNRMRDVSENNDSPSVALWPSGPLRQLLRNDAALLQAGGARDSGTLFRCGAS